jgi:trans-2,3-dihydro-3-hydroxyanthranilate isomerase
VHQTPDRNNAYCWSDTGYNLPVKKVLRYVIVDVFTDQPLAGNPLAVFTDARGLTPELMQALARETNLSETTFVLPPKQSGHAHVRIFTPFCELSFAGHPTLGTAFVLAGPLQTSELRLELAVGIVPVRLERDGAHIHFGWMTQPPARAFALGDTGRVLAALGVSEPALPLAAYDNGQRHLCVPLASAAAVAALAPSFSALAKASATGVSVFHFDGQVCTARYFAPWAGVNEDPATGSAAGPIALYLRDHGLLEAGAELRILQGAEVGRPSTLYARVTGSEAEPTIEVGGMARIVARGQFVI